MPITSGHLLKSKDYFLPFPFFILVGEQTRWCAILIPVDKVNALEMREDKIRRVP
jgi:hypothetical protein